MTKDEIGRILENIARLLELKGENPSRSALMSMLPGRSTPLGMI